MRLGIGWYIFAIANVAMGAVDLAWRDFDPFHQPIQAFGENIPGREIYACITGVLLAAGGLMMLSRRTAAQGALILALINLIVGVFWLPRLYTAPHYLGVTLPVMAGVLSGLCRQLVIVAGALLAYTLVSARNARPFASIELAARWLIGLSAIDFGVVHLSSVGDNLIYVPLWMPPGRAFWVILTGIAFVLSGVAILARILDATAARLLGLMLLVFSAVTLLPNLVTGPHELGNWGGNVHEFVIIGAVWIFADRSIASSTKLRVESIADARYDPAGGTG